MFRLARNAFFAFVIVVAGYAPASAQDAVSPADTQATRSVIDDQINAFKAGDGARAYSHAGPGIKQTFTTVERFITMVQTGYMPLYAPQSYQFGRNALISGLVFQELLVTDADGKVWQAVYTLQRQPDGTWKITGVKLDPYNGVSA
jgi:uncharacterized membrane protein YedE/YeeE